MPSSCPRLLAPLALVFAAVIALGCAEERAPINKVQANALAKSFFVGDPGNPNDDPIFYWRNFVVDASEAQELIGIGSWSGVDRIRWDITENTLYARRSYPQNQGADNTGLNGDNNGTIVAAYPITSHFDIKRDYNPQTGEQLNVVVENTTDRPWYQRDYFRVDWSQNTVDTPDWSDMFIGKLTGDLTLTNVAYYVSDPTDPDAPHFEPDQGYFDITSKFTVAPVNSVIPGIPQCALLGFYTGTAIQSCDGQEATIRSSYWRVDQNDPDGDFEPFENSHASLDVIGNPGGIGSSIETGVVTPPLQTWDPGYGYVDPGMSRLMQVHNIWKQSHQTVGSCKVDADCTGLTKRSGSVCLASGKCTMPCTYSSPSGSGNDGDSDGNGTNDQCENKSTGYKGSSGSQCSYKNRCTIPYRDRETKPVAWWVNTDMPDTLQDTLDSKGAVTARGPTEDVVYTWNQAVNLAVAHAREVECRRTGGKRADCHALYVDPTTSDMVSFGGWGIERVKKPEDLVVTCHNPVRVYDSVACGARGATARVGDLRHHFIFYWPYASRAPWGGIADWNADPLTGQIIGAAATVMGRSVTYAAAQTRDIFLVKNGELDMSDITGGVPAALYQTRLRTGNAPKIFSAAELARRTSSIDIKHAAEELGMTLPSTDTARLAAIRSVKMNTTSDPGILSGENQVFAGIVQPLLGGQYEAQMISPSYLIDSAGLSPSTAVNASTLDQVSPLRGMDPGNLTQLGRAARKTLENHGVCDMAADEGVGNPDVRGVAAWFGDPNTGIYGDAALKKTYPALANADPPTLRSKRAGLIYDHLIRESFKGIALHEVGHGMGMLHNFASSYDAVNYEPQYWQLRTNEGAATASCNATARQGEPDTCMGPRFLDPETNDEMGQDAESRPGINYFGNTSTMEYQNERFFESAGLGQFDLMTMGALYGRVLETFDQDAADGVGIGDQPNYQWLNLTQLSEDDLVNWTTAAGSGPQAMHYTELARRIKLYDTSRCRPATAAELSQAEWRVVHGKVCTPPPKDYAAWGDFADVDPGGGDAIVKDSVAPSVSPTAAANEFRWPFRWGDDEDAYLHVNPSDAGADPYEVTEQTIEKFDYSYPFNYFRRQRRDWNYINVPSQTARNFFERLRSYHWVTARNGATLPSFSATELQTLITTDDTVRSNLLASSLMLDAIQRAMLMPQAGNVSRADPTIQIGTSRPLYDVVEGGGTGTIFALDASEARFVDPTYDTGPSAGGSWDYLDWILHAGFDTEKDYGGQALTDGRPTLEILQRDTFLDGRHLNVNFRTDLATGVDRLLGGVLSGDWATVASYVPTINDAPEMLSLTDAAPKRPAGSFLLFPDLGYLQQLNAIINAEAFSGIGTDLTLQNKLLIYLEGTEGVISIPDAQTTKFTDPRSGYTYVARLYGPDNIDGVTVDQGIGSRMLAHANTLLAGAYQVQVDASQSPVLDQYGRPTVLLDASGQPLASVATNVGVATTVFSDYVGLLDATVQIARDLGHGPGALRTTP